MPDATTWETSGFVLFHELNLSAVDQAADNTDIVPMHGGGKKSGKNPPAIVAGLVVAAGAIAISGGALGGPALLGHAFGANIVGAAAASLAVGLPSGMALATQRPCQPSETARCRSAGGSRVAG